jgi:lipopolysaccharide biosynthesis regulator YciM
MDPNRPNWNDSNSYDPADDYVPLAEIVEKPSSYDPSKPFANVDRSALLVPPASLAGPRSQLPTLPHTHQHSKSPGMWIAALVVLAVVVIGGVLVAFTLQIRDAHPRIANKKFDLDPDAFQEEFGFEPEGFTQNSKSTDTSPISELEIEAFFAELEAAIDFQSRRKFQEAFDTTEFANTIARRADFKLPLFQTLDAINDNIDHYLSTLIFDSLFDSSECDIQIAKITPLEQNMGAHVYARLIFESGKSPKIRFWCHRTNSGIKIYDFEEIKFGNRATNSLIDSVRGEMQYSLLLPRDSNFAVQARNLTQIHDAVVAGDFDWAERLLMEVKVDQLASNQKSFHQILSATVMNQQGYYKEAIEAANDIPNHDPDSVSHFLLAARAHCGLRNFSESMELAEQYQQLVGVDSDALRIVGLCQKGLWKTDEASASLQQSLDENPNNYETIWELLREQEPEDAKKQFQQRLAESNDRRLLFNSLASVLENNGGYYFLRPLVESYEGYAGNDLQYAYYYALTAHDANEKQTAVSLLKPWLSKLPEIKSSYWKYGREYARAAKDIKPIEEIYADFADPTVAVLSLGHAYIYDGEQLLKLADLHAKKAEKDDHWLYYRSRGLLLTDKPDRSFLLLKHHLSKIKTLWDQEDFFEIMISAAARSEYAVAAYQSFDDKKEIFARLASRIAYSEKADQLNALIREHTKNHPDDVQLQYYKALLLSFKENYSEALDLLLAAAKQNGNEEFPSTSWSIADFAIKSDRMIDAYEQSQDKDAFLGSVLYVEIPDSQTASMEKLVKLHQESPGETPNLLHFKMNLAIKNEKWEDAFEFREKYNALPTVPYPLGYVQITFPMFEKGQWRKALDLTGHDKELIRSFTTRAIEEQKKQVLIDLIDIAKQHGVSEHYVSLYEIAALMDDAKHEAAIKQLESFDKTGDEFAETSWLYDGLIAECYIQLGQLEKIETLIAEAGEDSTYTSMALALAIANGDEKAALAAASEWAQYWEEPIETLCDQRLIQTTVKSANAQKILEAVKKMDVSADD